jgi:hypothetical protein
MTADQRTTGTGLHPITISLCGDVMTGRGIDEILPCALDRESRAFGV